jgi:AcrR family transcriptional regulator
MGRTAAVQGEGLRERGKREKLARIVEAARELFSTQGYAETTLRDVARRAEVATGTIFLYAKSKDDLLAIVFEREFAPAVERGLATLPAADIEVQLLHMFKVVGDLHARDVGLSLVFVRELTFRREPPADGYVFTWHQSIHRIIDAAQARGEITSRWPAEQIGGVVLREWLMNQIRWLSGRFDHAHAEKDMQASLAILFHGLRPGRSTRGGTEP